MSSVAPDRWAGTEPPSPPPREPIGALHAQGALPLPPFPQSRLQEPLLGLGSPLVLSHCLEECHTRLAPPPPRPLPPCRPGVPSSGRGAAQLPYYSLASAAVESAATPSQERPGPGRSVGNRRAFRPGRRLRRGEPVRPMPAWEAVMTDVYRLRRSSAANYWAALGELARPFQV